MTKYESCTFDSFNTTKESYGNGYYFAPAPPGFIFTRSNTLAVGRDSITLDLLYQNDTP